MAVPSTDGVRLAGPKAMGRGRLVRELSHASRRSRRRRGPSAPLAPTLAEEATPRRHRTSTQGDYDVPSTPRPVPRRGTPSNRGECLRCRPAFIEYADEVETE